METVKAFIEVDISLGRPLKVDKTINVCVVANSLITAELIACEMAFIYGMAVGSRVIYWEI